MKPRLFRQIAALLLCAIVFALLPTAAAQNWNMEYFLKKYSDTHFDLSVQPNRVMSVEEFLAVIYAYSYYGDGAAAVTAKDADGNPPAAWAAPFVQAEVNKGVVDPSRLRWTQPATLAFAAQYLCRAKGKYSYDAENFYSFTGTAALSADDKLYLNSAVDWGLIDYVPGMDVSAPIFRKDALRFVVPEGIPKCRTALSGSTATMRELHAYFIDCYWDLGEASKQFSALQALRDDVTMVTFQCAYWDGKAESGFLRCDFSHEEAIAHNKSYRRDPQADAAAWCRERGKLTFLGVTNVSNNAFVSAPVQAVLADGNAEIAANEIVDAVVACGLDGVNMGIELGAADAGLRDAYAHFLATLAAKLRAEGKLLLTTVGACFTDAQEQAGFYDYDTIGSVSDYVHVILYDDFNDTGYPYRKTDGAISNLTRFGRCLRYAATKMPPEKLLAGMGAYATDFDLTAFTAQDISYSAADQLRRTMNASVLWDSASASAVFSYTDGDGHSHRVWLETADSIAARVKVAQKYDLCGTSLYYIGTDAPALFRAVSTLSSYKPEIMMALEAKLIPTALRRRCGSAITRQDFCAMIGAFLSACPPEAEAEESVSFTDCDDPQVLRAASYGIVTGYGGGLFRPDNTITRQEAAVILARLAKCVGLTQPNGSGVVFEESASLPDWAKEGVAFTSACLDPVSGKRVMGGTGQNRFSPLANYTREQSAMTMIRLYHAVTAK